METAPAEDEEEAAAVLGELDALPPHSSNLNSSGLSSLGSSGSRSTSRNGAAGAAGGSSGRATMGAVGVAAGQPRPRRPTWRIVQGVSTESMALDVARRCRLPPAVLARASELYARLEPMAARQLEPSNGAQPAAANGTAEAAAAQQQQPPQQQEEQQQGSAAEGAAATQGATRRGRTARTAAASGATAEAASAGSQWTLEAAAATLQEVAQGALVEGAPEEPAAAVQQQSQVRRVL